MTRDTPSRTGRRTPLERKMSVREGKKPEASTAAVTATTSPAAGPESAPNANTSPSSDDDYFHYHNQQQRPAEPAIIQRPAPVATIDPPPRCGTAFSEAQTLVRENSVRSRSSIAKLPLAGANDAHDAGQKYGEGTAAGPVRSIFPEYNPALPLAQQNYYPTQTSPTRIPPEAISRRLYSPTTDTPPEEDATSPQSHQYHNSNNSNPYHHPNGQQQPQSPPLRSPRSVATSTTAAASRRWPPPRAQEAAAAAARPTAPPEPSTTEQLRDYWKVANGWKAPASEGRVYTMRVACERDSPVYTLSSRAGQPFYRMRLDPTSASAYVSLARFDPARVWKPPVPPKDSHQNLAAAGGGAGGFEGAGGESDPSAAAAAAATAALATTGKGWQEVIVTTLEEAARRHAPGDGLVSQLFPLAAARLAAESRATGHAGALAAAERECARLVWDDDSGSHFLVHPALAMPFCVTVERNPAWSRTEYTLEHIESPQHLARLTRDGTGTSWLEVDTGIASKIDAVYLVDVAVAALVLVAHGDGEFNRVEVFEPPPSFDGGGRNSRQESGRASRISRLSSRIGTGEKKKVGRSRLEEFELDLESQASDLKKHSGKDKDGVPGCARAIISVLRVTFKCFIWCATLAFRALTGLISLLARCLTSEKL